MRLFVAVDLDEHTRAAIAAAQTRIAGALGEGRSAVTWVRPDRMHLTLVFIGEVGDARVPAVVESMQTDVDAPPFDIVLETIGTFPPHGAPRVVWLGVSSGARDLIELRENIAQRIRALDLELESRPFHPHLTLGRWRTSSRSSDRRRILAVASPGRIASQRVDGATLYHSRLSSAGPTYTALARARLSRV